QEVGIRCGGPASRQNGKRPVVLTGEPEQRRSSRCRERDHSPVPLDDRAVILRPAALVELAPLKTENAREIERRLDVNRRDERRFLPRREDPGFWPRQTGGEIVACGLYERRV